MPRTYSHTLRTLTLASAVVLALLLTACLVGHAGKPSAEPSDQTVPYCPTEDSCRPVWAHGEWTIVETSE
jgi:hypothetical protein